MGGAPRVIKKIVKPIEKIIRPPSSPIAERRVEVAKATEPKAKKIEVRKLKRSTRVKRRGALMATTANTGLATTADYSPIRNPRDTGSKLGSA